MAVVHLGELRSGSRRTIFCEGKQAMESSEKNGDETVRQANQAVLEASHTIQTLTEEIMILQRALSKVPNRDQLKRDAERALRQEGKIPAMGLPMGNA
jgi:hypothetical protein